MSSTRVENLFILLKLLELSPLAHAARPPARPSRQRGGGRRSASLSIAQNPTQNTKMQRRRSQTQMGMGFGIFMTLCFWSPHESLRFRPCPIVAVFIACGDCGAFAGLLFGEVGVTTVDTAPPPPAG